MSGAALLGGAGDARRAARRPTEPRRDSHGRARRRVAPRPRRRAAAARACAGASARPRGRVVVDVLAALAGLGLGITLALGIAAESAGSLRADGGIATALGRLTGLAAAYAMVVVVVLVARCGPLERAVGQDRLVRWHRKLGPWPLYLLSRTRVLITVGYAQAAHDGVLHQLGQLLWTYPGILAATVAFVAADRRGRHVLPARAPAPGLRDVVVGPSLHVPRAVPLVLAPGRHRRVVRRPSVGARLVDRAVDRDAGARRRLPDRPAALALAAPPPAGRGGPARGAGHLLGRAARAAPHRLPVAGGQFLQWRFLRRGLWWQAHPYSLSAAPDRRTLRITVKDLGDHSAALARCGRARAWRSKGRTAPSPPTRGAATACCSSAPASASRRSGRCWRTCRATPTSSWCCAAHGARTWCCATRSPRSSAARRAPARARRPREQVPLDAARCAARARPRRARRLRLRPGRLHRAVVAPPREAGVAPDRIHHESFAL